MDEESRVALVWEPITNGEQTLLFRKKYFVPAERISLYKAVFRSPLFIEDFYPG